MFLYPNVLYISMGGEDTVRLRDLIELLSCCYVVFSKTRGPEKDLLAPFKCPWREGLRANADLGPKPDFWSGHKRLS
jgi:hypothetical protein